MFVLILRERRRDVVLRERRRQNQSLASIATIAPTNCAAMNCKTPFGAIPAKVSDRARAIVTAGLAKDVEAVNQ